MQYVCNNYRVTYVNVSDPNNIFLVSTGIYYLRPQENITYTLGDLSQLFSYISESYTEGSCLMLLLGPGKKPH